MVSGQTRRMCGSSAIYSSHAKAGTKKTSAGPLVSTCRSPVASALLTAPAARMNMLNRIAPRRSPRPRRRLRSASSTAIDDDQRRHGGAHEESRRALPTCCPARRLRSWAGSTARRSRSTPGLPRTAAASIRIGTSGRSGYAPSHAARASAKIGGIHRGVDRRELRDRQASLREQRRPISRRCRRGRVRELSCDVSICAGTASRLTSRPVRSSVSDTIPERVAGGFSGVTMLAPPIGTNRRGLWRYQNSSAGG